jgi:N-acetylglutamate synthase-like GNAT family acetyltransferase
LHVYGGVERVNTKGRRESIQHSGLGTKLLQSAEEICKRENMNRVAIISGIGVRNYYEKRGYDLENHYMVKKIAVDDGCVYTYMQNKVCENRNVLSLFLLGSLIAYTRAKSVR